MKPQLLELSWEDFTSQVVLVLEAQPLQHIYGEEGLNYASRLMHASLGIATEVPELIEAWEKGDGINAMEELGDIFWYVALALYLAPKGSIRESLINRLSLHSLPNISHDFHRPRYVHQDRIDWLIGNLKLHATMLADASKSGFFYGIWANPSHVKHEQHLTTTMASIATVVSNAAELAVFAAEYADESQFASARGYLLEGSKINLPRLLGRIASKLESRYPAGHFEALKAVSRDLDAERKELEA